MANSGKRSTGTASAGLPFLLKPEPDCTAASASLASRLNPLRTSFNEPVTFSPAIFSGEYSIPGITSLASIPSLVTILKSIPLALNVFRPGSESTLPLRTAVSPAAPGKSPLICRSMPLSSIAFRSIEKRYPDDRLISASNFGTSPCTRAPKVSFPGTSSAIRPVAIFRALMRIRVPAFSSVQPRLSADTSTPSMSILNDDEPAWPDGSFAAFPPDNRSSKLVRPSLWWMRSTDKPDNTTRSMTTCFDSSGKIASDARISPTVAKVLDPSGSDSRTLPTVIPNFGKTLSRSGSSIERVLPVLVLTAEINSGLYLSASKPNAMAAIAAPSATTSPINTYRPTFTKFMTCPHWQHHTERVRMARIAVPIRHDRADRQRKYRPRTP